MVKIGKADEEALYRAADPLQKAVLQGAEKEDRYEYEGLFEGGSEGPLWLRIGASVERRNSWGKALRIVGAMWDETVVKQAQQELGRARDLAQEAVRTKAAFLANMSHEMRTPLSAVVGLSELLRQQKLEREAAELVDLIQTSGKGLTDLVNDILELSRIEAGRMLLHAVAASIEGCCKDAMSLLTHPGDAAGVVGLPGAVKVDPNRLRQVLLNLLGNAIKFTEKGEIFGRAVGSRAGKTVGDRCGDRDCGGAPGGAVPAIYASGHAGKPIARRSGTGAVDLQESGGGTGGEIGLRSVLGEGAEFWFTFPAEPVTEEARGGAKAGRSEGAGKEHLRVLVVEDNGLNRLVATRLLSRLGVEAATAEDGEKAVSMARETVCDLILMDVQMAGVNGLDAARAPVRWGGEFR